MSFDRVSAPVCTNVASFIPDAVSLTRFLSINRFTSGLSKTSRVDDFFKCFFLRDFLLFDQEADQKEKGSWKALYLKQRAIERNLPTLNGVESTMFSSSETIFRNIQSTADRIICDGNGQDMQGNFRRVLAIFDAQTHRRLGDIFYQSFIRYDYPTIVPVDNGKIVTVFDNNTLRGLSLENGSPVQLYSGDLSPLMQCRALKNRIFGVCRSSGWISTYEINQGIKHKLLQLNDFTIQRSNRCFDVRSTAEDSFQIIFLNINGVIRNNNTHTIDSFEVNIESGSKKITSKFLDFPNYKPDCGYECIELEFVGTKVYSLFRYGLHKLCIYDPVSRATLQTIEFPFDGGFLGGTINNFKVQYACNNRLEAFNIIKSSHFNHHTGRLYRTVEERDNRPSVERRYFGETPPENRIMVLDFLKGNK